MTNLEIKKLPESEIEITGEIEADIFESFRGEAVKETSLEVKVDGFRSGNVPEKILIEKVGEGAILETMAEMALQKEYQKILEENKIFAIGRPQIIITKIAKNNPLGFKIKTAVVPEVRLPDYKKISSETKGDEKENSAATEEEKIKAKNKRRAEILEKISDSTELEIPKLLIESEKKNGGEKDAEKRIKFGLVLGEIARQEKIAVTEEELDNEVEKIMGYYKGIGQTIDEHRVRDYAYGILMNEKVFQLLETC